jgi:hypothetical protein
MATAFTNLQARLGNLAIELEKAGVAGGAKENFGHALRLALRSPGLDYLFFVGDQPVLTAWGSETGQGGFDNLAFDPRALLFPEPGEQQKAAAELERPCAAGPPGGDGCSGSSASCSCFYCCCFSLRSA